MMPDEVRDLDRQLTQRLEDKYGRENVEKAVKLIESTAIAAIVATNPELAVAKAMVEAYTGRDMATNQPLTLAEKADRFAQAIPGYSALRSTFEVTSGYRLTDFEKLSPQERGLAGLGAVAATLPAVKQAISNGNTVFAQAAETSGANISRVLTQEEQAAAGAAQQASRAEQQAAGAVQRTEHAADDAARYNKYWDDLASKPGSLSNRSARQWYLSQEERIPQMLDKGKSLEDQAQQAFTLRNEMRTRARDLMEDRQLAERLMREEPNTSWEELKQKYMRQGLSGDALWQKIIGSSQTSRGSVNEALGLQ